MPSVRTTSLWRPEANLTPQQYADLIDSPKGYRVRWEKATFCPFRSPQDPLNHDATHTDCDQGYVYYGAKEIRALITGVQMRQQYMQSGRFDAGTAMVTVKAENKLSFLDKITLLDSVLRFSELVRRQDVGVADRLKYIAVAAYDVRDKARVYRESVDFRLSNGNIEWIENGQQPEEGASYSVSYDHRPVYIVTDLAHAIRDTNVYANTSTSPAKLLRTPVSLPVQAIVKLHFLLRDGETNEEPV